MKLNEWLTIGFILLVLGAAFAPILPVIGAYLGIAIFAAWFNGDL